METTENDVQPTPTPGPGLVLTTEAQYYLKETGKWARFLGIVGFVICGLLLIMAFSIGTLFSVLAKLSPAYSAIPAAAGVFFSGIIILEDILYFFFALYLFQFGARIKNGLALMSTQEVTIALSKLKSFFKLAGIVTIIGLCLLGIEILVICLVVMTGISH